MDVRGIEGLTLGELIDEVKLGGRFVVFNLCLGLGLKVKVLHSPIYFVRADQPAPSRGFWRTLASALLGWWAIPNGPSRTLACIRENRAGGSDITAAVLTHLGKVEREIMARGSAVVRPRAA